MQEEYIAVACPIAARHGSFAAAFTAISRRERGEGENGEQYECEAYGASGETPPAAGSWRLPPREARLA
jgi:hypothetical protein